MTLQLQMILGQMTLGLINGSFYALLALGLAIIVSMLGIINFAQGAFYMMGAFVCWMLLEYVQIGYWPALVIVPLVMGVFGIVLERVLLRPLYGINPVYGLLLTFGIAQVIQSIFRIVYGISGRSYAMPEQLSGAADLGYMILPYYRGWVLLISVSVCVLTIVLIERTRLGSYLRAAMENPRMLENMGVNVPLMITLTFGFGLMLAGLGGTLAAPMYQVSSPMGAYLVLVAFAIVVIGGIGSLTGAVITGFAIGIIEGMAKVLYPEGAGVVIFIVMAMVLLVRPAGLFGRA